MLDHDDLLDRRCIDAFSRALEENGFPDAVYSDEDKVDARGEHFELYCKPDFSPELLLTQMYLCHFTIFRTDARAGASAACARRWTAPRTSTSPCACCRASRSVVHLPRPLLPLAGLERVDRADHRRQAVGPGRGRAGAAGAPRADLRRRLRRARARCAG